MVIDSTPLVCGRWVRSLCWDEHDDAGREQTGRGVESPRPSRCSGGSELIGAPSRAVGLFGRVVWAHETISLTELSPRGDMSDVRQGRSGGARKGLALALVVTTVFLSICGFVLAVLNGAAASAIEAVGAVAFAVVGALIAVRRPENRLGWLLGGAGVASRSWNRPASTPNGRWSLPPVRYRRVTWRPGWGIYQLCPCSASLSV